VSRVPLPYSSKILELFRNPKNQGKMEDATVSAVAGSPACGDMIAIYLKISKDEIIERATFESYGCAANIATASISTEMIKGRKLEDAWKLTWKEVANELGGLPSVKFHCGTLSVGAIRRAIRAYYKKEERPSWMPEELTTEEKHALEEEELAKILSKRIGSKE
jgi:nitrogen fixation NifU-like protein